MTEYITPGFVPNLPPFEAWLATNIPAVYDNTMSYYDELTSLIKYLESEVIPAVNESGAAVAELQGLYTELKNFVNNYFDNLDVQEEINNKLDDMAQSGELTEIIGAYLQTTALWCFDTVADMKLSANLIAGSYARTLGFRTLNDGGGAIYKITNSGTANEMDVIAVGSTLYANLQHDNRINVKQLGAYADDTNADDTYISRGVTLALSLGLPLYIPDGTYKVTTSLDMKSIEIDCSGYIHNTTNVLKLGAVSSGATKTNVNIQRCNDVQIEGAKNSYFNIVNMDNLTLYANGEDSSISSIAYCRIEGISCSSLTINGINDGWINENEINIKRCSGDLIITGDGTYSHNNNHINNISIEGSTKKIQIDVGHDNYIYYRGESNPVVTIASSINCFGNVVDKQYTSIFYRLFDQTDINTNTTLNFVGKENQPTIKMTQILAVNKKTMKTMNNNLYINSSGLIAGNGQIEYQNTKLSGALPFALLIESDIASQRVYIKCFDENNQPMEANVRSTSISWNSDNQDYRMSSDTKRQIITYYPTDGVDRIELSIKPGSHGFGWANAYMISNFYNIDNLENEIDTLKKCASAAPTNTSRYYDTGDIIYNDTPTTGGNIGWVCVEGGHPGTWKAFGEIAA